jgi:hypothetical protein
MSVTGEVIILGKIYKAGTNATWFFSLVEVKMSIS